MSITRICINVCSVMCDFRPVYCTSLFTHEDINQLIKHVRGVSLQYEARKRGQDWTRARNVQTGRTSGTSSGLLTTALAAALAAPPELVALPVAEVRRAIAQMKWSRAITYSQASRLPPISESTATVPV